MNDVARLWSAGFALGASFENTVVFDDDRLLNTEGLRYADECARHKVLDAVGDLALAGLPLLGAYRSVRGGHKLNHAVLSALMADRSRLAGGRGRAGAPSRGTPKPAPAWSAAWSPRPMARTCPDCWSDCVLRRRRLPCNHDLVPMDLPTALIPAKCLHIRLVEDHFSAR